MQLTCLSRLKAWYQLHRHRAIPSLYNVLSTPQPITALAMYGPPYESDLEKARYLEEQYTSVHTPATFTPAAPPVLTAEAWAPGMRFEPMTLIFYSEIEEDIKTMFPESPVPQARIEEDVVTIGGFSRTVVRCLCGKNSTCRKMREVMCCPAYLGEQCECTLWDCPDAARAKRRQDDLDEQLRDDRVAKRIRLEFLDYSQIDDETDDETDEENFRRLPPAQVRQMNRTGPAAYMTAVGGAARRRRPLPQGNSASVPAPKRAGKAPSQPRNLPRSTPRSRASTTAESTAAPVELRYKLASTVPKSRTRGRPNKEQCKQWEIDTKAQGEEWVWPRSTVDALNKEWAYLRCVWDDTDRRNQNLKSKSPKEKTPELPPLPLCILPGCNIHPTAECCCRTIARGRDNLVTREQPPCHHCSSSSPPS
ncbi:hypothetical protein EJ04DRAFT_360833 [Polyplosphaeria fusca]|uniref:Uncharacterized protein n=1 Tax=Polyplosphaeria fusca TaxID=682080 RepID=A0A9P4QSK1_9PLEO|nr:hypothetical protein EJ04DRAFT_360833 [Polyplosphaeria fusca]